MHRQVFGVQASPPLDPVAVAISKTHLHRHGLAKKESPVLPSNDFTLPKLQGINIEEHFYNLGLAHSAPFLDLARGLAATDLPPQPDVWQQISGWVRYEQDGSFEPVHSPPDDAMVFDVESLYNISPYAVMATAATQSHWFSWTSPWLIGESDDIVQLIPLPGKKPTLLVGHNVGYDRARISEEYHLTRTENRFLDTMSLHVAVRGLSSHQRAPWMQHRKKKRVRLESGDLSDGGGGIMWQDLTSMNSLADVANLHCGIEVDKSARDWYGSEDKTVIVNQFQELMSYCAGDVVTTHKVFKVVLPAFLEACPNPVTFAGILHMGNSFLPVDDSWSSFLEKADNLYQRLTRNIEEELQKLADQARKLMFEKDKDGRPIYETDPWLLQLDWTPKRARKVPDRLLSEGGEDITEPKSTLEPAMPETSRVCDLHSPAMDSLAPADHSPDTSNSTPLKEETSHARSLGSPAWFKRFLSSASDTITSRGWNEIAPLLLKMTWNGYPLQYNVEYGWFYAALSNESQPDEAALRLQIDNIMDEDYTCFKLSEAVKRTIFNSKSLAPIENGQLSSPYPFAKALCELAVSSRRDVNAEGYTALQQQVLDLARAALEKSPHNIANDPWLSQLDWSARKVQQPERESVKGADSVQHMVSNPGPLPITAAQNAESKQKATDTGLGSSVKDQVWPQWYWHMWRPRSGSVGMDLSIRSRAAPLLLRLRWQGYELAHSRAYGWLYRVPRDQASPAEPGSVAREPINFELNADLPLQDDREHVYYKLPHKDGADGNVGTPLSKTFIPAFEDGILSSEYPAAAAALEMNAQCSYWISARERVINQLVVWENQKGERGFPIDSDRDKFGVILPQLVTMGTVTRRAVESTWLAASNAKKNRLGSELKAMIRAPPGHAIVGADVDSEELWICSVMGDAQFGVHGATAIGWMTLEGTKSAGTDLHSKTASILGISRDKAKVFNYSRIYGAGVKHAVQLLMQANHKLTKESATKLAKALYASTKGLKQHTAKNVFERKFWYGGTESHVFNTLEAIAMAPNPRTPALGCGVTAALAKANLPETERAKAGEDFMPSRINWVVQSSGVDYLHLLIVSMEYLIRKVRIDCAYHVSISDCTLEQFDIDARFMISVHDEIRYLVKSEDQHRAALALQISNLWTRALFSYRLQMESLPQVR